MKNNLGQLILKNLPLLLIISTIFIISLVYFASAEQNTNIASNSTQLSFVSTLVAQTHWLNVSNTSQITEGNLTVVFSVLTLGELDIYLNGALIGNVTAGDTSPKVFTGLANNISSGQNNITYIPALLSTGNIDQTNISYVYNNLTFNVTDCGNLTVRNGVYNLVNNVKSNSTCFRLQANNITFNGQGFNVNYSNYTTGIGFVVEASSNFSTIKNTNIYQKNNTGSGGNGANAGINVAGHNTTILNNTLVQFSQSSGNMIVGTGSINITNNNIVSTTASAINSGGNLLSIVGNKINTTAGGGADGINIGTSGSYIAYNNITDFHGGNTGIRLGSGSNNQFVGNIINTIATAQNGIGVGTAGQTTNNNSIVNNTVIVTSTGGGISLASVTNVTLTGNKVNTTGNIGYQLTGTTSSQLGTNITIDMTNLAEGLPVYYNNTLNNVVVSNINYNIGQVICSSCNNVTYNLINMSEDGISLLNSSNSQVSNSMFNTTNGLGILLSNGGKNNTLFNNNIRTTNTNGYGVYVSGANATNATGNKINTTGSSAYGITFATSLNGFGNNNIVNTTGSSAYGIFVSSSNNATVNNNNIYTIGSSANALYYFSSGNGFANNNVINATGSSANGITIAANNNNLNNNTAFVYGSSGVALYLSAASTNNISNSSFSSSLSGGNSNFAIELFNNPTSNTFSNLILNASSRLIDVNSQNNNNFINIYGGIISGGGTSQGIVFNSASNTGNINVYDSIFSSTTDFIISTPTANVIGIWNFTNVTRSDGSPMVVSWSGGANGTLNTRWWINTNVTDSVTKASISGANVNATNVSGILFFTQTTDATGNIPRQAVIQFVRTNISTVTTRIDYGNYTFIANMTGYTTLSQSLNITTNTIVNFSLVATASNTCTYVSGNWNILCSDFCNITTNANIGGNNITINGTGVTIINGGNLTNWRKVLISGTSTSNICIVRTLNGGGFKA